MDWFVLLFFIISIIIYLISYYYSLKKEDLDNKIENFENEQSLTAKEKLEKMDINIVYLNAKDAIDVFKKSDQYMQNMNQPNLNSRKCQTLKDLYDRYMSGLDDITEKEKDIINKFLLELINDVKRYDVNMSRYLIYWLKRISFAKGKEWLESGMPHTLGNVIIMDSNWFINPRNTTLIHEITHIHQRNFFYEFEDLYFLLGYVYYPKLIKGLEPYYQLNRNNPDGSSIFWLWRYPNSSISTNNHITIHNDTNNNDYYWIGAVFKSANPISVTDVNYLALKLTRSQDGTFYFIQTPPIALEKFKKYNDYMGIENNNYHPNETTAKFMEWYMLDKINDNSKNIYYQYQGYNVFKNYMDELIKKYYSK